MPFSSAASARPSGATRRPRRLATRRPRRAGARRRARARRRPPRRGRRGHLRRRQPGRRGQPQRRAHGRAAGRAAGRGPGYTVNRLCASSLQAVAPPRSRSAAGEADVVVAGGVESMTRAPMVLPKSPRPWAAAGRRGRHHARLAPGQPALQGDRRRQGDHQPRRDRRGGRDPGRHQPRGLRRLGSALQQLTAAARERLALDFVPVETGKGEVPRTRCRARTPAPRRWPSSSPPSRPTAS